MIGAGLGATSPGSDFTRGETVLIVGALPGSIAAATDGLVGFLSSGHR